MQNDHCVFTCNNRLYYSDSVVKYIRRNSSIYLDNNNPPRYHCTEHNDYNISHKKSQIQYSKIYIKLVCFSYPPNRNKIFILFSIFSDDFSCFLVRFSNHFGKHFVQFLFCIWFCIFGIGFM